MTPSEHVGQRVRMYREKRGLSLTRFAAMIHKSTSTVSKYESGNIVIDVNVLVEMANALEVTIGQLIDYKTDVSAADRKRVSDSYFQRADLYYLYAIITAKTPRLCAMELSRNGDTDDEGTCVLYLDIEHYYHHTKSQSLYTGTFRCFDNSAVFHLENPFDASDVAIIYARPSLTSSNIASGIFTLLPSRFRNPCSTKVLFSTSELPIDKRLTDMLTISDKETITTMRKHNIFLVSGE